MEEREDREERFDVRKNKNTEGNNENAQEIMEKCEKLLDNTAESTNSLQKQRLMRITQDYVAANIYTIKKQIESMAIKEKLIILARLKKLKEDEIRYKTKKEKQNTKNTVTVAIIIFIATIFLSINNGDQTLMVVSLIAIVIISGILFIAQEYITDINSSKKELSSIETWLEELREEERIAGENQRLKKTLESTDEEIEKTKRENKIVLQANKKLEAEIERLKEELEQEKISTLRMKAEKGYGKR